MIDKQTNCPYCHDPHPASGCCYFDVELGHWIEQKLISKYDQTKKIEDLFSDVLVKVVPVSECPECGRILL